VFCLNVTGFGRGILVIANVHISGDRQEERGVDRCVDFGPAPRYLEGAEVSLLVPDARVELIEGEVVDMAPIGSRDAAAVSVLAKRLIRAIGDSAEVRIQSPVRLHPVSEPQPDIAVLTPKFDSYKSAHPEATDVLLLIEADREEMRTGVARVPGVEAEIDIHDLF
jgi:hypothetical protein